jgi:phage-related protein
MERFTYTPDYGAQLEVVPRVRKAQFGDGYGQRSGDGLNTTLRRWAVQFTSRRKEEADGIEAFLRAHRGVAAFEYVVPDSAWSVTGFSFGTGDGARTQYPLRRPLSAQVPDELVPATGWTATPLVYRAGVLQVAGVGYTLSASGLVTFATAPAAGASLTFIAEGADVARVVCARWTSTVKGFNAYDVSAELEEVA